jgi:non-heme chloroperoxidase
MLHLPVRTPSTTSTHRPNHAPAADGVDRFYRGRETGKSALLLSGWVNSSMLGYQTALLGRDGFRCVAYDRRSRVCSRDSNGGYDFDTLTDEQAAVIESLDVSGVTAVARSFSSTEIERNLFRHGSEWGIASILGASA